MRQRLPVTLLGLCALVCSGCLHQQVGADGRDFRQAVLEMYEQQAVDNLVQAANGQPLVHIDYRALTVTDSQVVRGSIGGQHDPFGNRSVLRQTATLVASAHSFTNRLLFGGSAGQDCQMQFTADPLTGNKEVYEYYLAFAHDSGLFCVSAEEPAGPVHVKRECGGRWYWVPSDAAGVFLQLVLRTAFMRGPDRPPPIYWEATILAVEPQKDKQGNVDRWLVRFDRPVKNDNGFANVSLVDGSRVQVGLARTTAPQGSPVSALTTQHAQSAQWATDRSLEGRPAQVYAENYPNMGVKSPDLERLESAVASFKKTGSPPPRPIPVGPTGSSFASD